MKRQKKSPNNGKVNFGKLDGILKILSIVVACIAIFGVPVAIIKYIADHHDLKRNYDILKQENIENKRIYEILKQESARNKSNYENLVVDFIKQPNFNRVNIPQYRCEQYTKAIISAFLEDNYEDTIRLIDDFLKQFNDEAIKDQIYYNKIGDKMPEFETILNQDAVIESRWKINKVALCWYYLGRVNEKLFIKKNKENIRIESMKAFNKASFFRHAALWSESRGRYDSINKLALDKISILQTSALPK